MIEFLDNDPILTHSHSLTVTYPRRISITYGNYPFIEDIHNLIIEHTPPSCDSLAFMFWVISYQISKSKMLA